MASAFDANELNTGKFYFTAFQKTETGMRSFITNKDKTPIYLKSPKLFVKSIAEKHLTCEYMDDSEDLKQLLHDLERVAVHFIQRSVNEESFPTLASWEGKSKLSTFLKSCPEVLKLIRTNTLRAKNSDNNDISADELNQRCARVIFSPVCLDVDVETGMFEIGYYAFTAKEFKDERYHPPQPKSAKIPDFGIDPFV